MAIIVWNATDLIAGAIIVLVIMILLVLYVIDWIKNKINVYKKKRNDKL